MSLTRIQIPSPNYSSRSGSNVRLIVLHSSEGATTYTSLGNFFANPSSGVSSHVGIDDTLNVVGEYVGRNLKAWTAGNANPVAVQAELCCPAGASDNWTTADWNRHPTMLQNTAAWIAEEAAALGIPIVRLNALEAQSNGRGVCQHSDLGTWGGGHRDCGPNFPIDAVIAAAAGSPPAPKPPEPEDEDVANYTICAAVGSAKQYLTDMGSFKRPIANEDDWNATVWCLTASGAKVYYQTLNDPVRVPQALLDNIPDA